MPRRSSLKRNLSAIDVAFAELERTLAQLSKRVRQVARNAARKTEPVFAKRRQLKLTPKRRAQLKLQGAYMGYMRQLGPRQKARVKAVKAKRGFEAAISVARGMTSKR
jgi:hypothetical protein